MSLNMNTLFGVNGVINKSKQRYECVLCLHLSFWNLARKLLDDARAVPQDSTRTKQIAQAQGFYFRMVLKTSRVWSLGGGLPDFIKIPTHHYYILKKPKNKTQQNLIKLGQIFGPLDKRDVFLFLSLFSLQTCHSEMNILHHYSKKKKSKENDAL